MLPQDKMVHIGGSSGIAVFSGFLVYTFFNRWPPKVSPVNHIEGVQIHFPIWYDNIKFFYIEIHPRAFATELTRMMAANTGQRVRIIKLKTFFRRKG